MPSLRIAEEVLREPPAAAALIMHGREGLHRYALRKMLALSSETIASLYRDIEGNARFNAAVTNASSKASRPLGGFVRPADLYVICRSTRPGVVVETGVASGLSSAFILQALEDNSAGKLYSIDLPNADQEVLLGTVLTRLPEGEKSGWVVPDWLRHRWDLRIGRSRDILPSLLREVGMIDIFLHDSEHSFDNMMFEFEQAWPKLNESGYLLADDVNLAATQGAFYTFARKIARTPERIYAGFGAISKSPELV